ncbi:MAG: hypothetical protein IJT83_14150 [Victivallales bacterium]|nr:hypothetical protein [Victivallales bacterium]
MKEEAQNTELLPFSAGESICALVWLPAFCALALLLDYIGGGWTFTAISIVSLTGSLIAISYILLNLRRLLGEALGWSLRRRMLCTVPCIIGGPMFCHCLIVAVALKKHRKVTAGCAVAGILLGGAQWLGVFWFLMGVLNPDRTQMMFFALCSLCSYALAVFNTLDLRRAEEIISRRQWGLFASGLALWTLLLCGSIIHVIQVGYADKKTVLTQIEEAIGGHIPTREELLAAAPPESDFTAYKQFILDFLKEPPPHYKLFNDARHDSSERILSWFKENAALVATAEKLAALPIPRPAENSLYDSLWDREDFIFLAAEVIAIKCVCTKEPSTMKLLDNLLAETLHYTMTDHSAYKMLEEVREDCSQFIGIPYAPFPPEYKKLLADTAAFNLPQSPGYTDTTIYRIRTSAIQCFAGIPIRLTVYAHWRIMRLKEALSQYNEATNGMEQPPNPRN